MASPPFNIDQSLPGDSDVVSQFPGVERTYRDVTESWLLIEHDANGKHKQAQFVQAADAGYAGTAAITTVWASSDDLGDLHKRQGTSAIEWVGVPPGTVVARFDTSVPNGYTACNGAAISRTVAGVRLFALYGVSFGVGDGASTFNLPTCTGKVLVGVDAGSVNVAGFTVVGTSAGAKNATIAQANLPAVNFTVSGISLNDPGHSHTINWQLGNANGCCGLNTSYLGVGGSSSSTVSAFTGITIATQGVAASGGSGTGLPLAQAGIAVNYVIKL